jgi:5-methylcytosine-specific restriction endonuclease McrA
MAKAMNKADVTKEWIYEEYVNKQRTMDDLRKELHCRTSKVSEMLISWNIPKRTSKEVYFLSIGGDKNPMRKPEVIEKLSGQNHYFIRCPELRKKFILNNPMKTGNKEAMKKVGAAHSKEKSNFWKGGITSINLSLRSHAKMKEWRLAVFNHDNFTCCICHIKGGKLNADHVIAFSKTLKENSIQTIEAGLLCKELWNTSNGRTLCVKCHRKTDNYGAKGWRK